MMGDNQNTNIDHEARSLANEAVQLIKSHDRLCEERWNNNDRRWQEAMQLQGERWEEARRVLENIRVQHKDGMDQQEKGTMEVRVELERLSTTYSSRFWSVLSGVIGTLVIMVGTLFWKLFAR